MQLLLKTGKKFTMSSQPNQFNIKDVVAVACAVDRTNGFVKKSDVYGQQDKKPNVSFLYEHFCNNEKTDYSTVDLELAEEIIDYLKGLSFKALERRLTEFETNVLNFVGSETVSKEQLGIAASLPNVYRNKLEADTWTSREAELARTSEYIGEIGKRGEFSAKIENLRYIAKTSSYLVSCSVDDKHILKFFSGVASGKIGDVLQITGFVKSQGISSYSNAKETMINRIKIS
jgi:hypothetical protein